MKVLVKLYNMEEPASDGSRIPRRQTEEYIASDDYKIIIDERTSLGGFTHKDRQVDPKYRELIGPNDQVLVSNNYTHVITRIFVKPGEPYCYAIAEIFDEDKFSGEVRDNIINLKGLIRSGVKLPVSVVIQAMWNTSGMAEKIIRIRGFDFTQDPSFAGSGFLKTMSATEVPTEAAVVKTFSNNVPDGCRLATKVFSAEVEILEDVSDEDSIPETVSYKDIVMKYGLNSKVTQACKNFSLITVDQLKALADEFRNENPDEALLIDILFDWHSDVSGEGWYNLQDCFHGERKSLLQIIKSVPEDEPNRKEIIMNQIREFIMNIPDQKIFSTTITSVRDRLMMTKFPKFSLIKKIFRSYKYYYEVTSESLSDEDKLYMQKLLIEDLNLLLKLVSKQVIKGSTISSLYNLNQFSPEFHQDGIKLSKIYRRVLISERFMGFVPTGIYSEWKKELSNFYSDAIKYCFGIDMTPQTSVTDTLI